VLDARTPAHPVPDQAELLGRYRARHISFEKTPTFGVFVRASDSMPFDPGGRRSFVVSTYSGNTMRGSAGVAETTR